MILPPITKAGVPSIPSICARRLFAVSLRDGGVVHVTTQARPVQAKVLCLLADQPERDLLRVAHDGIAQRFVRSLSPRRK